MRIANVLLEIAKTAFRFGQTFWSPAYGNVTYGGIVNNKIVCTNQDGSIVTFDGDGKLFRDGECMLYPGKNDQDWVTFARLVNVPCPLYEELRLFLSSRNLLERVEKELYFTLNDHCWLNLEHPEYWVCGLNPDKKNIACEGEWHDYVLRKLAE